MLWEGDEVDAGLTQEQLQAIWDEEARGDAGDKPAEAPLDAAPLADEGAASSDQ